MKKSNLVISLIAVITSLGLCCSQPVLADLPPGNAITDANAILRYALPVEQKDLRELQEKLEATRTRSPGNIWTSLNKAAISTKNMLSRKSNQIISDIPSSNKQEAQILISSLKQSLETLEEYSKSQNKDRYIDERNKSLQIIGDIEALFVEDFPYEIPSEFDSLPRLLGRATVDIKTTKGNLTAVIDGYNAPLTGGAFVDLAMKGFYDGLPFTRAEDFYVLQSGDPEGPEKGYINPISKEERRIPLEIRVPGEKETLYNKTFEDIGLYRSTPVLPFSALGTLGWAHSPKALDDGSSQFFFFLFDAELTPAGRNLIDGRNAAFGYVVDGKDILKKLGTEDRISTIKVIDGADRLQEHA